MFKNCHKMEDTEPNTVFTIVLLSSCAKQSFIKALDIIPRHSLSESQVCIRARMDQFSDLSLSKKSLDQMSGIGEREREMVASNIVQLIIC